MTNGYIILSVNIVGECGGAQTAFKSGVRSAISYCHEMSKSMTVQELIFEIKE